MRRPNSTRTPDRKNPSPGSLNTRLWSLLILVWCLPGCEPQKASPAKKTAPAKIEHPDESDIYRIVLTPKAEERLQISTAPVELKAVPRTRTVGGEVVVPDGASILVTAPVVGTLKPAVGQTPVAGQYVTAGQVAFHLTPLLTPEREVPTAAERVAMANAQASLITAQITADGDTKQTQAQVEAAQIALNRAKRLLADKAGSERDVDDAVGKVVDMPVLVPRDGLLRMVSSSVGQVVGAAAPLFEVVDLRTLWVRVPVYSGQQNDFAATSNSLVRGLGGSTEGVSVKPIEAPPSADPLATTVDLFYELPNPDGRFRPGERLEIVLPLKGQTESLVVPRAAILRDIHGVAWVYVNSAEHTFERHRVEVHFTTKELSILSQGPEAGTLVVVDGAAELFGTEFGAGK
jgi:multidrug efflux pump subunit AcrA (membrane-fusion protein)